MRYLILIKRGKINTHIEKSIQFSKLEKTKKILSKY